MSMPTSTNEAGTTQIASEDDGSAAIGAVESGLRAQIARQEADGELDPRWAGSVALAVYTARVIDGLRPDEKAYAKAQLITAAKGVFEMLPKPEKRDVSGYEAIVRSIQDAAAGVDGQE